MNLLSIINELLATDLCRLAYDLVYPTMPHVIMEMDEIVQTWKGITAVDHRMGGRSYLFEGKEIGHIHWNGNLDIRFGRELTSELVASGLVQRHAFVPASFITFKVEQAHDLPFALSLLQFAYLRLLNKLSVNDQELQQFVQGECERFFSEVFQCL